MRWPGWLWVWILFAQKTTTMLPWAGQNCYWLRMNNDWNLYIKKRFLKGWIILPRKLFLKGNFCKVLYKISEELFHGSLSLCNILIGFVGLGLMHNRGIIIIWCSDLKFSHFLFYIFPPKAAWVLKRWYIVLIWIIFVYRQNKKENNFWHHYRKNVCIQWELISH